MAKLKIATDGPKRGAAAVDRATGAGLDFTAVASNFDIYTSSRKNSLVVLLL
jgi:hypothetical protein